MEGKQKLFLVMSMVATYTSLECVRKSSFNQKSIDGKAFPSMEILHDDDFLLLRLTSSCSR